MNLTYYRNFIAIVESGTISAASRKLHIAQPALSAQLKALERELGAELLQRTARKVLLTDAGRILYEKARSILTLQEVVEQQIAACGEGGGERVWLGLSPALPDPLVGALLLAFSQERPELSFELFESEADGMTELLKNGVVELALMRVSGERTPLLHTHALVEERLTAVFRRGNPWLTSALREVPAKMLREAPVCVTRELRKPLEDLCHEARFVPQLRAVSSSQAAALLWAAQGAGIAILADSNPGPREEGELCYRPLGGSKLLTYRALVSLADGHLSPAALRFADFCRSHLLFL